MVGINQSHCNGHSQCCRRGRCDTLAPPGEFVGPGSDDDFPRAKVSHVSVGGCPNEVAAKFEATSWGHSSGSGWLWKHLKLTLHGHDRLVHG